MKIKNILTATLVCASVSLIAQETASLEMSAEDRAIARLQEMNEAVDLNKEQLSQIKELLIQKEEELQEVRVQQAELAAVEKNVSEATDKEIDALLTTEQKKAMLTSTPAKKAGCCAGKASAGKSGCSKAKAKTASEEESSTKSATGTLR